MDGRVKSCQDGFKAVSANKINVVTKPSSKPASKPSLPVVQRVDQRNHARLEHCTIRLINAMPTPAHERASCSSLLELGLIKKVVKPSRRF